jgi:hypothetical protein
VDRKNVLPGAIGYGDTFESGISVAEFKGGELEDE